MALLKPVRGYHTGTDLLGTVARLLRGARVLLRAVLMSCVEFAVGTRVRATNKASWRGAPFYIAPLVARCWLLFLVLRSHGARELQASKRGRALYGAAQVQVPGDYFQARAPPLYSSAQVQPYYAISASYGPEFNENWGRSLDIITDRNKFFTTF